MVLTDYVAVDRKQQGTEEGVKGELETHLGKLLERHWQFGPRGEHLHSILFRNEGVGKLQDHVLLESHEHVRRHSQLFQDGDERSVQGNRACVDRHRASHQIQEP